MSDPLRVDVVIVNGNGIHLQVGEVVVGQRNEKVSLDSVRKKVIRFLEKKQKAERRLVGYMKEVLEEREKLKVYVERRPSSLDECIETKAFLAKTGNPTLDWNENVPQSLVECGATVLCLWFVSQKMMWKKGELVSACSDDAAFTGRVVDTMNCLNCNLMRIKVISRYEPVLVEWFYDHQLKRVKCF